MFRMTSESGTSSVAIPDLPRDGFAYRLAILDWSSLY